MFKVYWTKNVDDSSSTHSSDFGNTELTDVLVFMESLRKDSTISFVTMCSENPNSVGKPGVAEVGPDYNWTKRRHNERIKNNGDEIEVPMDEE